MSSSSLSDFSSLSMFGGLNPRARRRRVSSTSSPARGMGMNGVHGRSLPFHLSQQQRMALFIGCLVFFVVVYLDANNNDYLTSIRAGVSSRAGHFHGHHRLVRFREAWVTSSAQPFNENGVAHQAKNLIIVAGHSVTVTGHLEDANQDEQDWFLLDYQKHRGLPAAIVAHIKAGLAAANEDTESLLVFSGGQTRPKTGPDSEGSSYFRVVDAMDLWPASSTVRARTISEEFATDSFENLMFSICRFHEVTGSYPAKITMVSFSFKQTRFETLHAPALRWPASQFVYIGVDPPADTGFDLAESTLGEQEHAAKPFETDPYGCHSDILQEKRKQRNPFSRTAPYPLSCPDMQELLQYCGPELIPPEKVPW